MGARARPVLGRKGRPPAAASVRAVSPRTLTGAFAAGRTLLGLALLLAPERAARGWVGDEIERPAAQVLCRGLGARDMSLGLGTLLTLRNGGPNRRWLEAAILADGVDVAATLLAGKRIPRNGRLGTIALAGGSAVLGAWLSRR